MKQLPLFIDIVLIENIVDAFQWSQNNHSEVDKDEIEEIADLLINEIPYCGFI